MTILGNLSKAKKRYNSKKEIIISQCCSGCVNTYHHSNLD
jgi:hypothetical protein